MNNNKFKVILLIPIVFLIFCIGISTGSSNINILDTISILLNKLINIPLRELKLKENILIAAIIHDNEVIIPSGNDVISIDDNVIVVTTNQYLKDLNEILE